MTPRLPTGYAANTDDTDSQPQRQHPRDAYNDAHDAETLADFGLDLPLEWYEGIVIKTNNIDSYIHGWELQNINPENHDYVIIQPIGVGPFINHNAHIDGEEPIFVNVYAVREYDFPGESYRLDSHPPDMMKLTRRNLEKLARSKTVVQQLKHGGQNSPEHWQNPENDPENLLEE